MKKSILPAMALLSTSFAFADEGYFSVGIGAGYTTNAYIGYRNDWAALPIIQYENDYFYIDALNAGLKLWQAKDESQELLLGAYYMPRAFKPSKSKDKRLGLLNERRSTVMADLSYNIYTDYGAIENTLSYDMLGRHKGVLAVTQYALEWEITPTFTLTPAVGLTYASRKFNQHSFGISEQESQHSGLPAYLAKSSLQPHIQLIADYQITEKLTASAMLRVENIAKNIRNSPMIDERFQSEVGVSVLYHF